MLANALPACAFCGSRAYHNSGGHFGLFTQQGFTCAQCDASVQWVASRSGGILSFVDRQACGPDDYGDLLLPKAYSLWVNKVLFPAWRHRADAVETFQTQEWDQWLDEKFRPAFPDYGEYPKGNCSYYNLPDEAKAFITATWGTAYPAGSYLPLPDHLKGNVYPPQAPNIPGVRIFVQVRHIESGSTFGAKSEVAFGDQNWEPIDYDHSASLVAPEDPILRRNREFFQDVWAQVAQNLAVEFPQVREVENEYNGIAPWYSFTVNGDVFTVGWRKRVVSISVDAPSGLDTQEIATLAAADQVTYSTNGPLRIVTPDEYETELLASINDMPEQKPLVEAVMSNFRNTHPNGREMRLSNKDKVAHTVLIHAWGKEKTVEYLTSLCRTSLLARAA